MLFLIKVEFCLFQLTSTIDWHGFDASTWHHFEEGAKMGCDTEEDDN